MRSSTSNKFIGLWDYDLKDALNNTNKCTGVGGVWTLAEVAAAQTQLGVNYFWPTLPSHQGKGPDARGDNAAVCAVPADLRYSEEIVNIRCSGIGALCAGAGIVSSTGCSSDLWRHKLGFQWEYSTDKGKSWFRFPGTTKTLQGEKISIGMAAHYHALVVSPTETPNSTILPGKSLTNAGTTSAFTQFYGVIDSVRISRGVARYTTPICQPYDPRTSAAALIDDAVVFALNIGRNVYQIPGGTIFPYYIKGRGENNGWLVPGQPVYAGDNDTITPSIRNFLLNTVSFETDDDKFSLPVFAPSTDPNLDSPNPSNVPNRVRKLKALGKNGKIELSWQRPPVIAPGSFTYSLVSGTGSADNAFFTISGNTLRTSASLNFETKRFYSVRVRAVGQQSGNTVEKFFVVSATNINESLGDIFLSNTNLVETNENQTVGFFSTNNPDADDSVTYTLVSGAGSTDNGKFSINGDALNTATSTIYSSQNSYSIRVRATDQGGIFVEKTFSLSVTQLNTANQIIGLYLGTVSEGQPVNTYVGYVYSLVPYEQVSVSFISGPGDTDNALFRIDADPYSPGYEALFTNAVLNYRAKRVCSIRLRVTKVEDGTFNDTAFIIPILNAESSPTDIILSNTTILENQPSDTVVGVFSVADPDPSGTHNYFLTGGVGSTDNASFIIDGNTLLTAASFNFESKASYSIRVQAVDPAVNTFIEKTFTISVVNVDEAADSITLSNSVIAENQPANTIVGTLAVTDAGSPLAPTGYKIEYKTHDSAPVVLTRPDTTTTHTIDSLTNGQQHQIRVRAYNQNGDGPWSYTIRCTPRATTLDYVTGHRYLAYSNSENGYRGRCGIQFPAVPDISITTAGAVGSNTAYPPAIPNALVIHDAMIPPRAENKRVIYADCATTGTEKTPLIAAVNGKFYGRDRVFDSFTTDLNTRVLVKDQKDAALNGVYIVKFDPNNQTNPPWQRLRTQPDNTGPLDNFFGARVVVLNGRKNAGTVWNCTNQSTPTIDETPLQFERDILLGLHQEDFCVEAYFKAHSFRQPPLNANSRNMTLIDTYYRSALKDPSATCASGIRIYFSAELSGKQGYAYVDVGDYERATDDTTAPITALKGPALRSKLLDANVFYHIAVTRADDTFRLYIDGELQDQFTTQDGTYEPLNLTRETNHIRYRVRPYFGLNDYGGLGNEILTRNRHVSQYARFNVLRSEFFFKREAVNHTYSEKFNGAALMLEVLTNEEDSLNLPTFAGGPASWPGRPTPNYPADAHVYIYKDFDRTTQTSLNFLVAPNLRFVPETAVVELATVPPNATYQRDFVDCDPNCEPVPNRGNIQLYGLFAAGSKATGAASFIFSSSATFTIPRNLVLSAPNGIIFNPRSNYKVVQKGVNDPLAPTEGKIVMVLSSTASFSVLNTLRLTTPKPANITADFENYTFAPKENYTAVFKPGETNPLPGELLITAHTEPGKYKIVVPVESVGAFPTHSIVESNSPFIFNVASPNPAKPTSVIVAFAETAFTSELKIEAQTPDPNPAPPSPNYAVSVPVMATTNATIGNLQPNVNFAGGVSGFIPASVTATFIQASSKESFVGGSDDSNTPLTIDGVPVKAGMRILVKNQNDQRENGIYVVNVGAWTRATDMNQTAQIVGENRTRRTFINGGYTNSNEAYLLNIPTAVLDKNVILGFTDLPFQKETADTAASEPFIVYIQQSFAVVPVVNPSDIQSMRDAITVGEGLSVKVALVSTANLSLNGTPPPSATDGVQVTNRMLVLARMQDDPTENGIYRVNLSGPWTRFPELSLSQHFPRELLVSPSDGTEIFDPLNTVAFRMQTPQNFVLGRDHITFSEKITITKIHLPFRWGNTDNYKGTNTDGTGLPTSTGGVIEFDDFIPDDSTRAAANDAVCWRVFLRCGNTIAYSRVLVLRAASKVGIDQVDASPTLLTLE